MFPNRTFPPLLLLGKRDKRVGSRSPHAQPRIERMVYMPRVVGEIVSVGHVRGGAAGDSVRGRGTDGRISFEALGVRSVGVASGPIRDILLNWFGDFFNGAGRFLFRWLWGLWGMDAPSPHRTARLSGL